MGEFKTICEKNGIQQVFTVPFTPQQNRTLKEMARCMLIGVNLPSEKYGQDAILYATFIRNQMKCSPLPSRHSRNGDQIS